MKVLFKALLFTAFAFMSSLSSSFVSPTQNTTSQNITTKNNGNANTMQITWQDLQGKVAPYYDPFRALTQEQIYNLSIYGRVLELQKEMPNRVTEKMIQMGEEAKTKLVVENKSST